MDGSQAKAIRKDRGLSQEELGKLLGLSRRTVGGYEAGEAAIPPAVALAYLALFHRLDQRL